SEGDYCARLQSQYANLAGIGKFAAGNLYVGKYVKNAGTNGIVAFGHPFTLRPTALRFWLKYNCGTVDRIEKLPTGESLQAGDPDIGVIYVALGTWSKEEYGYTEEKGTPTLYGTDTSPVIIDTRNEATFFDPHGKDVVGYGEMLLRSNVDGWTQITLPIDYVATDIKPTHIVITFSASRYGDYFTGSTQSVMWLDDIELLYN
ncbi:MAG: PCMD domain-containing protein, partial [Alistipes sp.]|nr:PCMD domain-containing protein [Alistipes sp.]